MPWLHWESRGSHHVYALDWTVGALVTAVAAATLVVAVNWARRTPAAGRSSAIAVAVAIADVIALAAVLVLLFGVAKSRLFEGMFGRRSSSVIEHFWWPMTIQIGVSVVAGGSVAILGLRAVRRGMDGPTALGHLLLAGVASAALGYSVWLRPGRGMSVLDLQHPIARPLKGTRAWIHDSAAYVPDVTTTLSGWRLAGVEAWRSDGALEVEAQAVRGPLTTTKRFSIPVLADDGNPRLPLAVGRPLHFDQVDVAVGDGDVWSVVPRGATHSPSTLVIDAFDEHWIDGRHRFDVRCTVDGASDELTVFASNGVWWTNAHRWFRDVSLADRCLGRCTPPPGSPGDAVSGPLVCRTSHGHAWRIRPATD